jgi:hypothetical protein
MKWPLRRSRRPGIPADRAALADKFVAGGAGGRHQRHEVRSEIPASEPL